MDQPRVIELLHKALEEFREFDSKLLTTGVAEETLSHRLAHYLESELCRKEQTSGKRAIFVDCEYNRQGKKAKWIPWPDTLYATDGETTYYTPVPDIIVHSRTENGSNFLIMEIKKAGEFEVVRRLLDLVKLMAYLGEPLYYEWAVFLSLGNGPRNLPAEEALLFSKEKFDRVLKSNFVTVSELQMACRDLIGRRHELVANRRVVRNDFDAHDRIRSNDLISEMARLKLYKSILPKLAD